MKQGYKLFDHVRLKDGQEGAIVEILGDQDIFLVDVGTDPTTWDNIAVYPEDIEDED